MIEKRINLTYLLAYIRVGIINHTNKENINMAKTNDELKKVAEEILIGTAQSNYDTVLDMIRDEYDLSEEDLDQVSDLCNSATINISWN